MPSSDRRAEAGRPAASGGTTVVDPNRRAPSVRERPRHAAPLGEALDPAGAATRELVRRARPGGARFWVAVAVLGILTVAGLVALVSLIVAGPAPWSKWGYSVATLAFLLSTAQAAPILALATRLGKGLWGTPLRRAADLFALAGLVTAPLGIALLGQLPDWQGRPSIWFDWPAAPHLWDSLAAVLLSLTGLTLVYLSSLPDLAAARDLDPGPGVTRLALGWSGTLRQWRVLPSGVIGLGIAYLLLFAFVHLLVASDLAISLVSVVPGWQSAGLVLYHGVSALQGGIAATLIAVAAIRRYGGLADWIDREVFAETAKLLLGLSLLVFYVNWAEFLPLWYGRLPEEQWLLELLYFGPYLGPFLISFALTVVLPFLILLWQPVRASVVGPTLVAALVLIGALIDRVRIYVAAWSVAGPPEQSLPEIPAVQFPTVPDVLIVLGGPAAIALLYLVTLRLVPALSIWEHKTDELLRGDRPYFETEVTVVARPR